MGVLLITVGFGFKISLVPFHMWRINQKVFFGAVPETSFYKKKDLSLIEFFILLPSLIAIFWIGIYPKFFFQWFEVYVKQISVLF